MNDNASRTDGGGSMGQVVGLLQVITGLLVVIAIVLLLILVRGQEDQERSGATLPGAAVMTAA